MKITPGIYEVAAPIQFERGAQLVGDANPRATMPTRAEMCADLACAMGWTVKIEGGKFNLTKKPSWYSPKGAYSAIGCPDPFTNAADNRALVKWLAGYEVAESEGK